MLGGDDTVVLVERWSPVTSDLGLIAAPLEQIASAFLKWHASLGMPNRVERVRTGLADTFQALLPLSESKRRRAFVATKAGWTAQFQSGIQGSDPFPVMSLFAERLGVLAMRVCSSPSPPYPATIWEVYAPPHLGGDALNCRRSVYAANDGGRWVFGQSGAPFEFEDLASYAKPRKRDRFTREQLDRYLAEFRLFPFDDAFYVVEPEVPALVCERPRNSREAPEFSLEEVIAGKPWARA